MTNQFKWAAYQTKLAKLAVEFCSYYNFRTHKYQLRESNDLLIYRKCWAVDLSYYERLREIDFIKKDNKQMKLVNFL